MQTFLKPKNGLKSTDNTKTTAAATSTTTATVV
jgi:hypothetical protein